MRKISIFLLIFIVCMAIICGCTIPVTTPSAQAPSATAAPAVAQALAPATSGETAKVSIIASSFDPVNLRIKPGTTVTWINDDKMSHRVEHLPALPSDRLLFRSESLSPGQSFSYTFTEPGRYKYGDPQHAGGATTYLVIVE
jgi:plastocyanin